MKSISQYLNITFIVFSLLCLSLPMQAQVGIGTTTPNTDALLDIDATLSTGGLLLPRLTLTSTASFAPLSAHVQGMTVFNTATINDVTPGMYYNTGGGWVRLGAAGASTDWSLNGNAGTTPGTGAGQNYLGTADAQDLILAANGAETMRLVSGGQVAINNPAPAAGDRLTVTGAAGESVINGYSSGGGIGVYGEETGGGAGVFGNTSGAGLGVIGQNNGAGFGVLGNNLATGVGVQGQNNASGVGVVGINTVDGVGVLGQNNDTGIGVLAFGTNTGIAVQAQNDGATPALFAVNNSAGAITGLTVAGDIEYLGADIDDHTGVFGASGPALDFGVGVEGWGGLFGVLGLDLSGTAGTTFGVFAMGDSGASGVKAFTIDHPTDPANKILKHFSIESNEVLNIYRGTATFDGNGNAEIDLPDYYESINRDASYQLTAIGAAMPNLYVKSEITNGTFIIAGGIANKKVSWTVTAERNDPYLQQNPQKRENVIDKGVRRGKYFMPKLYNQPETKGMVYKERASKKKVISDSEKAKLVSEKSKPEPKKSNE